MSRLSLTFDPAEGWTGSLRLRNDYLGYLVTMQKADGPYSAIAAVYTAFRAGLDDPGSLDVARASYFRQITQGGPHEEKAWQAPL